MSSIDVPARRIGVTMMLLAMASAASADVLVVRSVGPSAPRYKPGTTMPDNQQVVLRQGDVLTLLDANGSWTLQGPVAVPAKTRMRNAAAAPTLASIDERRARIGAVRGVDGADGRPNLWYVDVAQAGPTCIVDTAHPTLWRADTKAAETIVMTGPGGATANVAWSAGQDSQAWPAALPVIAGGMYRLTGTGAAKAVTLTVKPVGTPPADIAATGRALIERGCSAQLDLLVVQSAGTEGTGS